MEEPGLERRAARTTGATGPTCRAGCPAWRRGTRPDESGPGAGPHLATRPVHRL